MKVGFIGTGNMGGALAHAAAQPPAPAELLLSNRTPEKAQALAQPSRGGHFCLRAPTGDNWAPAPGPHPACRGDNYLF